MVEDMTLDASNGGPKSYEEFCKEIDEYLALMERTKIDSSKAGRTDESYYFPIASYPMEMERDRCTTQPSP
jgi:hypothetical protein